MEATDNQEGAPRRNNRRYSVATLSAGAAMMALAIALILPSGALAGTQKTADDGFNPHGYVVVEAKHPDGTVFYRNEDHNLITNAGKDFISSQIGSTSPGANGANYIALTNTAITPAAGDTTLSGEIIANGLSRAQGTYAHTNGQSTYTVSKTFTASGSQSAQAGGLFTASSSGTMLAENTFTSVTLATNDQLTITWTITLS